MKSRPLNPTVIAALAVVVSVTLPVIVIALVTTPPIVRQNYAMFGLEKTGVDIWWGRSNLSWDGIAIAFEHGDDFVIWKNMTPSDMSSPDPPAIWHYGPPTQLGTMSVWLNITDAKGDGKIGDGDHADVSWSMNGLDENPSFEIVLLERESGRGIISMGMGQ